MRNRNFIKMSFHLIKHLILAGIYLTCKCMSQQIENNTLIYDWDVNHRMNLYCQFASAEKLTQIQIERKCFAKNKEMQHILADGTKTFPYAPHGSSIGFILKCGNIPYGKLKPNCSRYVYTNCSYNCGTSDVVHTATCNLLGPWDNVSPQWSLTVPCAEANSVPNTSSHFPETTSTSEPQIEVTASSTAMSFRRSTASLVNATASVAFSLGGTSEDMTPVVIACVLAGLFVVVLVAVSIACFVYKHKRRNTPSCPAHQEQCNGHSQNHVSELEQEPSAVDSTIQQPLCAPLLAKGEGCPAHQEQCNGHSQNHVSKLEQEPSAVDSTIQPPSCVPLLAEGQGFAFAELQSLRSFPDYNYAENNNKCKGMGDKNPLDVLNKCSKLNCESLDEIVVADMSGIVNYSRAQNGFVTGGPGTAVNVSNTQNGLVADLEMCNATVGLLKEQTTSYRNWLRAELEVISGRSRERALIGYVEENARALGYMPSQIKLLEKAYEAQVDHKVSDEFLNKLAAYGVKLGSIVRYFYLHGNSEAITAILEVHRDCRFCEKFRRL